MEPARSPSVQLMPSHCRELIPEATPSLRQIAKISPSHLPIQQLILISLSQRLMVRQATQHSQEQMAPAHQIRPSSFSSTMQIPIELCQPVLRSDQQVV